jgi:hypothetical protein
MPKLMPTASTVDLLCASGMGMAASSGGACSVVVTGPVREPVEHERTPWRRWHGTLTTASTRIVGGHSGAATRAPTRYQRQPALHPAVIEERMSDTPGSHPEPEPVASQ